MIEMAEISNTKKKGTYYKNCSDCGRFVPKDRWVKKHNSEGATPVCKKCWSCYDDPGYF